MDRLSRFKTPDNANIFNREENMTITNNNYKPYRRLVAIIADSIIRFLDRFGGRTLAQYEEKAIENARKKTGLQNFGDDSFREPLRILCEVTRSSSKVTTFAGRMLYKENIVGRLMNKLKIQAEIDAHPEILKEEIKEPIIIGGLPRTGSTILQRLLAEDPAHRSPLSWEANAPAPAPDPAAHAKDPRIKKDKRFWSLITYFTPMMKIMHPSGALEAEECLLLMNNDLISWWFAIINGDEYLDFLLDMDYVWPYRLHKRQLQLLQWKFPKKRWVLKTPSHIYGLSGLLEVYPDLRFVHIHRDPLEALPSIASLYTKVRSTFFEKVDPEAVGAEWFDIGLKYYGRGTPVREEEEKRKSSAAKFHDVLYHDLLADPIGTIEQLYRAFGLELSHEAAQGMKRYLKENPQNKYGKHNYTLEEFGLDEQKIKEKYGPYCERFGLW
jgi:hypothetical protein